MLRKSLGVQLLTSLNIRINADNDVKPDCKATSVTEMLESTSNFSAMAIRFKFMYL